MLGGRQRPPPRARRAPGPGKQEGLRRRELRGVAPLTPGVAQSLRGAPLRSAAWGGSARSGSARFSPVRRGAARLGSAERGTCGGGAEHPPPLPSAPRQSAARSLRAPPRTAAPGVPLGKGGG